MKKEKQKNYKGFTLLEMLVVVLIIGILAGIALPQYQGAVRKARVAEAKLTLRAIGDAADRYFLQNEDMVFSLEDLDIDISNDSQDWDIYIDEWGGNGCVVYADPKNEEGYDLEYYSPNYENGGDPKSGKFICWSDNDKGQKICKQLGGKKIYGNNFQL